MNAAEGVDPMDVLLDQRKAFRAFLVARVGNEADADDLLQNGLVKAIERADEIRDPGKAVAWFYQILRNAIVDHHRSRRAAVRRDDAWVAENAVLADDPEAERFLCACFKKLLSSLKPVHGELLRRVELDGEAVRDAAAAMGMTANNASVTLHRARAELRRKLADFCGSCSCLDNCECD